MRQFVQERRDVGLLVEQDGQSLRVEPAAGFSALRHRLEQRQPGLQLLDEFRRDVKTWLVANDCLARLGFTSSKFLTLHDGGQAFRFGKISTAFRSHDFIIGHATLGCHRNLSKLPATVLLQQLAHSDWHDLVVERLHAFAADLEINTLKGSALRLHDLF